VRPDGGTPAGNLDFLGRPHSGAALLAAAGRLAGGLAAQDTGQGPVLLFLPNTPTWPVALLGVLGAGRQPLLVDPRAPLDDLTDALQAAPPALAVTLDIGAVLDKLMRLLPALPGTQVRVARFAPELPFPRNLLFPLLRGGGLANLPDDPRFARLEALAGDVPDPPQAWAGPILTPAGPLAQERLAEAVAAEAARATPDERWSIAAPLADPAALAGLLGGLAGGARVLLSPRLDAKSLAKLDAQAAATRRIPDPG
jgi:acyl-CoA synthetase (AMP-forming)/AMP-acid ligase II